MKQITTHEEQLEYLRKIEGQVRGIQKMIKERLYCVDILNQVHSVISALAGVEDRILEKHFRNCVSAAMQGRSASEKEKKLSEILGLLSRYRKT
jgi:DNA-binding FrmR family transcriptional regulator